MYKTIRNITITLAITTFSILLVSCSEESSSSNISGPSTGTFTIANEYIDFHSWYGEITWSGSTNLNPALIVVSTDRVVKPWNGTATLSGKGQLTAAGITGVSVEAIYSRKFDTDALKTRKVYISVNELYTSSSYGSFIAAGGYQNIATEADYGRAPWLMRANRDYYVHIYYTEGGANKTYSHPFKTPDYPTTVAQADSMFPSTNWTPNGTRANDPRYFNIAGAPSPIEIKRDIADASANGSSFEPFIYSRATFYVTTGPGAAFARSFTHERLGTAGGCTTTGTCVIGLGSVATILTFSDHSSAYQFPNSVPGGTFGVVDFVLFTTNVSAQAANTDGAYNTSWGNATSRNTYMKSITE